MNQPDRVEEHFKTDGLFIVALNPSVEIPTPEVEHPTVIFNQEDFTQHNEKVVDYISPLAIILSGLSVA
ncbi:hypothetical protein [Noviherbaspirillum malthae]|uniref:hypothetical protein n=1 Tax=Noviherbaspirillum malthae TaxID=1260987 RepID=UPI00188EC1C1|nr:hypothetical protein [Noviherbaspirillum malthae]